MRAGRLSKRVTLQAVTNIPDTFGGLVETWSDVVTVWGEIQTTGAKEVWRAQQQNALVNAVITIRWVEGVTPRYRVKYGARIYRIHGVVNPYETNRVLQLQCEEVVTAE